jgi:putative endonuclease
MPSEKRTFGNKGEHIAEKYLKKNGYTILEKNYLVRRGEIDIIAHSKEKELVFVEVKTRKTSSFGSAIEGVSTAKIKRLIAAAYSYLKEHHLEESDFRIDVIGIDFPGPKIEHIKNAGEIQ